MKALKIMLVLAVAAGLLFAFAGVAQADDYGYVYGQAHQNPVVSISLSGAGSSSFSPLYYEGTSEDGAVDEYWGNELAIWNDGQCDADLYISAWSFPSDGVNVWDFADTADVNDCVWSFDDTSDFSMVNVPYSGQNALGHLSEGDDVSLDSTFAFPTDFDSYNTFYMTALITAYECN